MSRLSASLSTAILALALLAGARGDELQVATPPPAAELLPPLAAPTGKYLGALSCASASCHGRQDEAADPGSVNRREYALWLEHDPHAHASATVQSQEFERIVRRVSSGRDDGPVDAAVSARCAKCHDPAASEKGSGVFGGQDSSLAEDHLPPKTPDPIAPHSVARGITCETCHGPAGEWIAVHYERDVTRERLVALGMRDTKDLAVRARLCAGCHVGDGERDMNHDMIAAGHPPLRFELSAYHDLIRPKHWPPAERVRAPQFKARLWAEGQAATIQLTLDLVHARASRAAAGERLTPWPELAEYDCFACHQRLRLGDRHSKVASIGNRPGLPGWQPWNLALAGDLAAGNEAASALAQLRGQMNGALVTDAAQVRDLAAAARRGIELNRPSSAAEIAALVGPAIERDAWWAARGQQLLALRAADLAIRDERLRLQPPPGFVAVTRGVEAWRGEPIDDGDRRWRSVAAALQFGSRDFEWPAHDWEGFKAPPQTAPSITSNEQLVAELRALLDSVRRGTSEVESR